MYVLGHWVRTGTEERACDLYVVSVVLNSPNPYQYVFLKNQITRTKNMAFFKFLNRMLKQCLGDTTGTF